MRAVMLAAGDGGRLGAHTRHLPKPLVRLNGRPIVDYTLEAIVAAGATEAVVVTGYREAQVHAALLALAPPGLALTFVSNPRFEAGASLSLRAARTACGDEPFLLVMSDHVLSPALLHTLRGRGAGSRGRSFVAADFSIAHSAPYIEEATRLAVAADGRVTAIGKRLEHWSALDTGAFYLDPSAAWSAVDAAPEDCELSVIFAELARRGGLFAADVSGALWYDIDTPEDLSAAAGIVPAYRPTGVAASAWPVPPHAGPPPRPYADTPTRP
ncbi:MAG: NTP transferase domain-containing protein [Chloroflexi bacterium]|nr:NTP transferase domain-containing protein [Chloroflexota bacterium]